MDKSSLKITELPALSVASENGFIPIAQVKEENDTFKVTLKKLRESIMFENAYSDTATGVISTVRSDAFFVYTDETKEHVQGWVNSGSGATPLLNSEGEQVTYGTYALLNKALKDKGAIVRWVYNGGLSSGGEKTLTVPITGKVSVQEVYVDGLRQFKDVGFELDSDNDLTFTLAKELQKNQTVVAICFGSDDIEKVNEAFMSMYTGPNGAANIGVAGGSTVQIMLDALSAATKDIDMVKPPALVGRSIRDLLMDGEAGLRKHFGAKGDGITVDDKAFNDWWECLTLATYKRNPAAAGEPSFMLQKGPLLKIENGTFIYSGSGLNIVTGNSFVFNAVGESALSTKIIITSNAYLFDFDNNPVHSLLSNMTIYGGLGAVRFKSKSRNVGGYHTFKDLRLSRYKESGISNNSIDMPYFKILHSIFYGDPTKPTIGVGISGLSAGGTIDNCIFSDNQYGIKLSVGDNGTERNGPATPFTVTTNDFYRTGSRSAQSYDVWIEPGATTNNAGRGIVFSKNKFGQEFLISPDAHVLIADSGTGSTLNLNGDRLHVETVSSGFVSGVRFDSNNVSSANAGYTAPFIRSFTPNFGNGYFADSYDNGMPSKIIEFGSGITQSQVSNLTRTNVFDAGQCLDLQEGGEPKLLSNLNDVFRLHDPLGWFAGHPQQTAIPVGNQQIDFTMLQTGLTSSIAVASATKVSVNNSYGGLSEASEITLTASDGRAVATITGGVAGRLHWIDFEVKRGSSNSVPSILVEVLDSTGAVLQLRRVILLDTVSRWQKVVIPYTPNVSGNILIRFKSNTYTASTATNFIVGNLNVYINAEPINTGHNGGVAMSYSRQHEVKGTRHFWFDASGNYRCKNGAPTTDTDGVIVSANPTI